MAQRIAVVGNGEMTANSAAMIDACDLVVRFNFCTSYGVSGQRCDVVALCNMGRPAKAMLQSPEWLAHPAVQAASEIWSVRDSVKFTEIMPDVLARHPELDDFFEDFTADFAQLAENEGKSHRIISRIVHDALDAELSSLTDKPYVCPSSGLVATDYILKQIREPGDEVFIAGFGHQGWEGHPFDAEKRLMEGWIAKGELTRI